MKQSSLLNFFGKKAENSSQSCTNEILDTSSTLTECKQSNGDESFIIPGTPDTSIRSLETPLTGRAALGNLQLHRIPSPSPRSKTRTAVTRRSSFTIRREEIVRSKLTDLLSGDPVDPNENDFMRADRQARASAKLRRGNYDLLNYAPQDQIIIKVTSSNEVFKSGASCQSLYTSSRAKMMVSKALTTTCLTSSCKLTGDPLVVNPVEKLAKRMKIDDQCISHSKDVNISTNKEKTNLSAPKGIHLNTEELSVLDDVLNELVVETNNISSSKTCKYESVDLKVSKTLVGGEEQITQSVVHDETLQDLNLSDWTPETKEIEKVEDGCTVNDQLFKDQNQSFIRATVLEITKKRDQTDLVVRVYNSNNHNNNDKCNTTEMNVILRDSWQDSPIRINDVIHIIPDVFNTDDMEVSVRHSSSSSFPLVISDHNNNNSTCSVVCLHPNYLLPTTKIVGSLNCLRRAVLEQFWLSDSSSSSGSIDNDALLSTTTNQSSYGPEVMLIGSLVHELFQKIISEETIPRNMISQMISDLVHRPSTVLQMYALDMKLKVLITKLEEYVPKILNWIQAHYPERRNDGARSITTGQVKIEDVIAVEENIWSSRLGLKGKIDLTLLCRMPLNSGSGGDELMLPTLNVIPMELKTGNPSYSIEHKGQVYLYLLLAKEFYGTHYTTSKHPSVPVANAGWLVYLKEAITNNERCQKQKSYTNPSIVYPDVRSFRGLIHTRNQLVSGIMDLLKSTDTSSSSAHTENWKADLPNCIKQLRVCQMCSVQLTCSLFEKSHTKSHTIASNSFKNVPEFLSKRRSHLCQEHINFFIHWSKLLLTEHYDNERFEDVIGRICKSSSKIDKFISSGTVRGLRLLKTKTIESSLSGECEVQSWFILEEKSNDHSDETLLSLSGLSVGDLVIVSSDDGRFLGIDLATIVPTDEFCGVETNKRHRVSSSNQLYCNKSVISLMSTRPFLDRVKLFRIDRYITMKTVQLNLSNLVGLMQNSKLCEALRELIIDGRMPNTSKTISKRVVKEIRPILKPLNMNQRVAILQTLFSHDYILIKGYPGSGKTETLVALLRVLILLKKRILVAAHTHSAVDNLLLRLCQTGESRILRLGQINRIHTNLLKYSLESKLNTFLKSNEKSRIDATDYLHSLMKDAVVVGCTALSASGGNDSKHAALIHEKFDVVLIDEASQLMCPTSLGPLLCLNNEQRSDDSVKCCRFVLVGDPYQLPPLVRSQKAKQGGLNQSLFSLLLNHNHHHIEHDYGQSVASNPSDELSNKEYIIELTIQYRMNSSILALSNRLVYQNKMSCADANVSQATLQLKPGVSDRNMQKMPLWIKRVMSSSLSDSVLLLDTKELQCCVTPSNQSHALNSNPTEAQLVLFMIKQSMNTFLLDSKDIGIIAPYRAQVHLLKNIMKENLLEDIEVNTVDQFQGRDKRWILLCLTNCPSMLRNHGNDECTEFNRVHLLEDLSRLNVALTRARHKLTILGCTGEHNSQGEKEQFSQITKLKELFSLIKSTFSYEALPVDTISYINNSSSVKHKHRFYVLPFWF
ncbi:unnamed protein product [Trichobilharzia szidati]|nr:unnamed protein product [Trichobilharzia szidati]